MKDLKKRYTLTLEADARPNDTEGTMRLKRLLKALLRSYALKCVEVSELREKPTREPSASPDALKQEANS